MPLSGLGDPGISRSHQLKQRPPSWLGWAASIFVFTVLIICTQPPPSEYVPPSTYRSSNSLPSSTSQSSSKKALAAGDVLVKCILVTPYDDGKSDETTADGTLDITVHQGLAPLASTVFLDMVKSHHFDHKYLFRVVKGFIVQFGIDSPYPTGVEKQTKSKFPKVGIDPPPSNSEESSIRSNGRGSLNFAGGNSGTGQVYINRGKNVHLDKEPGSLPFATLDEQSMKIIDAVYSYKEGLGEVKAVRNGDEEVKKQFPRMSRIDKCWLENN